MIELEFTRNAKEKILGFMEKQGGPSAQNLRVTIPGSNAQGFTYQFFLEDTSAAKDIDIKVTSDGFTTVMDPNTADKMEGALIDWMEGLAGSGFRVENPNRPATDLDSPIEVRINNLFEQEINPGLAGHGGAVSLVSVKVPQAFIKLSGGCQGCASSQATLKQGIEGRIKDVAPEILEIVDTTDHAAGDQPYFT